MDQNPISITTIYMSPSQRKPPKLCKSAESMQSDIEDKPLNAF